MSAINIISITLSEINWIWFAFSVVSSFVIGALWYSLLFFNTWKKVFRVDMPDQDKPGGWIRSFFIQAITGTMVGLLVFVTTKLSLQFGIFTVLTIAGWQMCDLTFKYASTKEFLKATLIESGYTLAGGTIYIIFAQF